MLKIALIGILLPIVTVFVVTAALYVLARREGRGQ